MLPQQLFERALNIQDPWYIKDLQFSVENKRLDIHLDFHPGASFHYESEKENIQGDFKAYDTVSKQWRHLNFFEHECYLHARVPRVQIKETIIRQIDPPWSGLSPGFTSLFEALSGIGNEAVRKSSAADRRSMLWLGINAQPFSFIDPEWNKALKRVDERIINRLCALFQSAA